MFTCASENRIFCERTLFANTLAFGGKVNLRDSLRRALKKSRKEENADAKRKRPSGLSSKITEKCFIGLKHFS